MKRIHLFEFEDQPWFPHWMRVRMTRLIVVMHRLLNTADEFADLLVEVIEKTGTKKILDLCSGSGGPMPEVIKSLEQKHGMKDVELTLSDLFPDLSAARKVNASETGIRYLEKPINASNVPNELDGIRTLVGSFHHMEPEVAISILQDAVNNRKAICVIEISDNSAPKLLWWIAFPVNIIMCLIVTPLVKPMSWQQLLFTYLIPIIPICFAWDGAVSNARTYTLDDLNVLLNQIDSSGYEWKKVVHKGKTRKIFLTGTPEE